MQGVSVRSESTRSAEAFLAAGYQVECARARRPAEHLRNYIRQKLAEREAPADSEADRDSRVEMATGNMANGIGHSQNRQAEGKCGAQKSNAGVWKCCGQDRAAAPTKDQPERSKQFSSRLFRQGYKQIPFRISIEGWVTLSEIKLGRQTIHGCSGDGSQRGKGCQALVNGIVKPR